MSEIPRPGREHYEPHPRLFTCSHIDGIPGLVASICKDHAGGERMRRNIEAIGRTMGMVWQEQSGIGDGPGLIVAVPRAGVYVGQGLAQVLPGYQVTYSNQGHDRIGGQPVLALDQHMAAGRILVSDAVLFHGDTLHDTLAALYAQVPARTPVSVFVAVAYEPGIRRLLDKFPEVSFIAADVETKTIPRWDPARYQLIQTLNDLGDIGHLASR